MGRLTWGTVGVGLFVVGCVTPYSERVAGGPTTPTPAPFPAATAAPVASEEPPPPEEPAVDETVTEEENGSTPPPSPAPKPKSKGIDVEWSYFVGKASERELSSLAGPALEEQVGAWKCTISKQVTESEGATPVKRTREIVCKNWGNAEVGTSITCDSDRPNNDIELTLGEDVIAVACTKK